MPAPRRPTSAMRRLRASGSATVPNRSASAARARRNACVVAAPQQVADQQPFGRIDVVAEQIGRLAAERARDLTQHEDRRIADAELEVREVALRHARRDRQRPSRHSLAGAQRSDAFAERDEERFALGRVGRIVVRGACLGLALSRMSSTPLPQLRRARDVRTHALSCLTTRRRGPLSFRHSCELFNMRRRRSRPAAPVEPRSETLHGDRGRAAVRRALQLRATPVRVECESGRARPRTSTTAAA